jgi:hypothetical protein
VHLFGFLIEVVTSSGSHLRGPEEALSRSVCRCRLALPAQISGVAGTTGNNARPVVHQVPHTASSGSKHLCQPGGYSTHRGFVERSASPNVLGHCLRPANPDAVDSERTCKPAPPRIDEHEHGLDRDARGLFESLESSHDCCGLLRDATAELRLLAPADVQARRAPTEQPPRLSSGDLALVVLRVDHVDSGRTDGNVIDVGPRSGNAAVVKSYDANALKRIEPSPDSDLAGCSSCPGRGRLWRIEGGKKRSTNDRVSTTNTLLALRSASFVFATRRTPRDAELGRLDLVGSIGQDRGWLGASLAARRAGVAGHGSLDGVPARALALCESLTASVARCRIAQSNGPVRAHEITDVKVRAQIEVSPAAMAPGPEVPFVARSRVSRRRSALTIWPGVLRSRRFVAGATYPSDIGGSPPRDSPSRSRVVSPIDWTTRRVPVEEQMLCVVDVGRSTTHRGRTQPVLG